MVRVTTNETGRVLFNAFVLTDPPIFMQIIIRQAGPLCFAGICRKAESSLLKSARSHNIDGLRIQFLSRSGNIWIFIHRHAQLELRICE